MTDTLLYPTVSYEPPEENKAKGVSWRNCPVCEGKVAMDRRRCRGCGFLVARFRDAQPDLYGLCKFFGYGVALMLGIFFAGYVIRLLVS